MSNSVGQNMTDEARRLAELEKKPWYHSVSCACRECLDADAWVQPRHYTLKGSKRPLFPDGS